MMSRILFTAAWQILANLGKEGPKLAKGSKRAPSAEAVVPSIAKYCQVLPSCKCNVFRQFVFTWRNVDQDEMDLEFFQALPR
jgi:hypothetical protein